MKSLFTLIIVFIATIFCVQIARADDVTSSASVTNVVPISSGVMLAPDLPTITLTENSTTPVTVTATVTDDNGCENISAVSVKLFRTDKTAACGDDPNDCYTQAATLDSGSCTPGGSDLSANYSATISAQYYADPTDVGSANAGTTWSAHVTPSDGLGGTAGADDVKEMSTLTALNVTSTIAYGSLALGADTGTSDQTTVVTNTGNVAIDTQVDGYGLANGDGNSMKCTIGTVTIGSEKYSATALQDYATLKTALTDTAATVAGFNIAQRTDTSTSGSLYWGFGMPSGGVSGSCTGTVVFTAI